MRWKGLSMGSNGRHVSIKFGVEDKKLRAILESISEVSKAELHVGIVGSRALDTHPLRGNLTVGQVAALNEFGSRRAGVPRRSFIRSALRASRVGDLWARGMRAIVNGAPVMATFHVVGMAVEEMIRAKISEGVPPPNAPRTVAQKGHGHTLIHTETLYNAVGHEVVQRYGTGAGDYEEMTVESPGADVE